MQAYKKRVRFSETSQLIVVPDLTEFAEGVLWYGGDDEDSFGASYRQSVAEVRIKFARGDVNGIRASEILGIEKHLTRDLTNEYVLCREALLKTVLKKQRWQRVATDQSEWASKRARAAALLLEQDLTPVHQQLIQTQKKQKKHGTALFLDQEALS